MAARTADVRLAGNIAESVRGVERQIAQIGHVGLVAVRRLRMKDFARVVGSVLVELRADRQAGAPIGDRGGVRAAPRRQPEHGGAD